MRVPPMSIATRPGSWLPGALSLLFLTACATAQPAEDTGTVDVGYGEVDEEHVDGSVETVDGEEALAQGARTLADMLREIPGVQVSVRGGDLRVRIRGNNTSFLASEEPLVVVDGMEYRGHLGSINPYDIDKITVLKNAGDTAVYGARAANGVILITTKSGREASDV